MISSAPATFPVDTPSEGTLPIAPVPATDTSKGAFDAILALENLAATCNALSPAALEGVVEGLAETQADGSDDTDLEDGEEGELGALEFLAALLNTPTPFKPQVTSGAEAGSESAESAEPVASQAGRAPADAAALLAEATDSKLATDASPDKLFAVSQAAAAAVDGLTTSRDGSVDPAAQIARSAELFAQSPRHAAGPDRPGIATPMRDPRWAEEFGARVAMMVRGGESQASLQLSPVDLGPMDVSVTVKDSQASIHFGAAQAETRALIEASIPRLREMLAAQGFHLMDASVSQGFSREGQQGQATSGGGITAEPESDVTVARVTAAGLLDLYA